MQFDSPLLSGRLIKRYKRFMADVICDQTGKTITIHCPNSGSMKGVVEPGAKVWFSKAKNKNRKLLFTWELSTENDILVGVNTQTPNTLVAEGLTEKFFKPFQEYGDFLREVRIPNTDSRIDFVLKPRSSNVSCYIEVKNVHMNQDGVAAFPDAVTVRGTKHLETLMHLKSQGFRAVMIYIVQRNDLDTFTVAESIDPVYARTLRESINKGIELFAYACHVTPNEITLDRPLEVFV